MNPAAVQQIWSCFGSRDIGSATSLLPQQLQISCTAAGFRIS